MKEPNRLRIWLSVLLSGSLVVTGLFLFCPPSLFHSRHLGHSYLMEQPRYLTAVAGKSGRLAVSVQTGGKVRIYVEQGHAKLIPVTSGNLDADPAWDPAGTRIAYVSLGRHGKLALRVLSMTDGTDSVLLEQPLISQPCWSHDGMTILFLRSRPDVAGQSTICAVDLETKRTISLAETTYNRPQAWDVLGEDRIAYTYNDAVWIRPIRKPAERLPITFTTPCMVSAAPNNRLMFVCESITANDKRAILVDLQPRRSKQLYEGYIRHALWSPSGRILAIAIKYETLLFRANKTATTTDEWQLASTLKGIAVCWRSDSKLVLIRPTKGSPHFLEEEDLQSQGITSFAPYTAKP